MGKIELRPSAFGGALVGEVQAAPALSWSEHQALIATQRSAAELSSRAWAMGRQLEEIGLNIRATAIGISALENRLGLRLDVQTELLSRQVSLLDELAAAVRTPAKTRAAERLTDVGELLRRERWTRALSVAESVTEDDPNNPEGFLACAWASLGLGSREAAREYYVEAAEAADGLRASELGRQAARLALVTQDGLAALKVLQRFAITAVDEWPDVPWTERGIVEKRIRERTEFGAITYDRAVYAAASGDDELASEALRLAGQLSPEFLAAAQQDAVLLEHPILLTDTVEPLAKAVKNQQVAIAGQHERAVSLQREAAELELESDPDLAALTELADRLDAQLEAPAPLIAGELLLNDMLLDHIEQLALPARRRLQQEQREAEEERLRRERAQALLGEVETAAREFAATIPGASVARTGRSRVVNGVDIPIWVVAQPGGFLRSEKKWHVSAGDEHAEVVRYY